VVVVVIAPKASVFIVCAKVSQELRKTTSKLPNTDLVPPEKPDFEKASTPGGSWIPVKQGYL
jgi:hypothetical protein